MINNMVEVSPLVFLLVVFVSGGFGYYKGRMYKKDNYNGRYKR